MTRFEIREVVDSYCIAQECGNPRVAETIDREFRAFANPEEIQVYEEMLDL